MGLLDRIHASKQASKLAKQRQLTICVKAARAMRLPQAIPRILQSVEMRHTLKNMGNDVDAEIVLFPRAILQVSGNVIAMVCARFQLRAESCALGVPSPALQSTT
jgi:hypothetical protein